MIYGQGWFDPTIVEVVKGKNHWISYKTLT